MQSLGNGFCRRRLTPASMLLAWLVCAVMTPAQDELLHIHFGDLPIVISAPHGGTLPIPDVPPRTGEGLTKGPSGFFTGRDTGTEELALAVAQELDERLPGRPSWVISRVHRKYVDFNRPPEIAVEHPRARVVYDQYHDALRDMVRRIREEHQHGLLIDIHGQGSSAVTVFRGTNNGLTVSGLRQRGGDAATTGPGSLTARLKSAGWIVHPDPFTGREQSGFTGGHIVRSYGSHRADGIDAIQLEFGGDYRKAGVRTQVSRELADAVVAFAGEYLNLPEPAASESPE